MQLITQAFDYQNVCINKLSKLKVGALYMEMGTGKTRTALGLIQPRLEAGKVEHVIWLCPCSGSVKRNLRNDLDKHTVGWNDTITICGIETLSSSRKENARLLALAQEKKCYLVVDESLLLKNPYAIRSRNIIRLSELCQYKLILNGTPISKTEADLFAQWYILDWRILGYRSFWSFAANHLEYDDKYKHKIRRVLNVDYLTDKISPYTYQVTKEEVLNLPKKSYRRSYFNLTDEQRTEYERVKDDFLDLRLLNSEYDDAIIYRTFNALQQVASGERIITPADQPIQHRPMFQRPEENPRLVKLLDVILQDIPNGEKAIIWCKFTHEITAIKKMLEEIGETFALCHGGISQKRRALELERFAKESRFLIANKGCAGFGLNLQYCSWEVFYDNDWDWATREQAEDRLHRVGQQQEVHVIDICAECSIDERIMSCILRKESMVQEFKRHVSRKNLAHWLDGKDSKNDSNRVERGSKAG